MSDEPEISSDIEKICLTCTAHTGAFFYFRYTAGRHGASSWLLQCLHVHDVLPFDILGALVTKNTLGQTFYSVAGFII